MKKKILDLEALPWSGSKKLSTMQLIETFFQFNELVVTKEMLNTLMRYTLKKKAWRKGDPSTVFHWYLSMRSLIRVGYGIRKKEGKWKTGTRSENTSPLFRGSLSENEYQNPVLVFQKTFRRYSIEELDGFIADIVYFSLGAYKIEQEKNSVNLYIRLIKMLDAARLILERECRKDHQ